MNLRRLEGTGLDINRLLVVQAVGDPILSANGAERMGQLLWRWNGRRKNLGRPVFVGSHPSTIKLWMDGAQNVLAHFMSGPPAHLPKILLDSTAGVVLEGVFTLILS